MDASAFYAYASSAWLALQSIPLLVTPKLIISLVAPTDNHQSTDTEIYLARLLAFAQLSIVGLTLFSQPAASYPLTFVHVSGFVYIYVCYTGLTSTLPATNALPPNTTGLLLGLVGYGIVSCVGIWAMVFSGAAAHVSKRTGADKRTSGWPFGNVNAYNPKVDRKMGKQG